MNLKSFMFGGVKHHPPGVTQAATDYANAMGDAASGRPWQEDRAGKPTDELLAVPDPRLAVESPDPASLLRPVGAVVLPAKGETGPLTLLTKAELLELASRLELDVRSKAKKAEIIRLIIGE